LNFKFKDFLGYGSSIGCNNDSFIYFFLEDLLKKNNIKYIKCFNINYNFTFKKIIKRDFIFFSKFFYKFKSSSIYCVTIPYDFFFFFLNFLKKNLKSLYELKIFSLMFIFKGFLYDLSIFLNINSLEDSRRFLLNIFFDIFNFVYFIDILKK